MARPGPSWSAVILAGGAGHRLGGVDKPALLVRGRPLLDHAVEACADGRDIVVVGPRRTTSRPVHWTIERPPGGGPVAALAAGLSVLPAVPTVVVLAADLPAIDAVLVGQLVDGGRSGVDGVVALDSAGRQQPLVAAYRRRSLDSALAALGDPRDRPFRALVSSLTLTTITAADGVADIDTPGDLARWQAPGTDAANAGGDDHGCLGDGVV